MKTCNPWQIGTNYFIRTVTHHYTGRLEAVYQKELVLSECAWIADDGRFHTALSTGELNEVEPMLGNVIIGRASVIDASVWTHKLPRTQK
jgi:hypothetical protein